jgi:hypothetical protein
VCAVLLVGRWLDLYLMIAPPFGQPAAEEVALQAGLLFGGSGLFYLALSRALGGAPLVPVKDPFLVESLPHGRAEQSNGVPQSARAAQAGR